MPGALFDLFIPITALGVLAGLIWGVGTTGSREPDAYLDREFALETATPARRLSAHLIELALWTVTGGIGWLIWFAIVAPRGQSPGKALLSLYVIREDGQVAGGWYMWGRELLTKWVLCYILAIFTGGLAIVVGAAWCLWSRDRQALWDKIVSSYVAHAPEVAPDPTGPVAVGELTPEIRLRQLQALRAEGVISASEYEERRQRLVGIEA